MLTMMQRTAARCRQGHVSWHDRWAAKLWGYVVQRVVMRPVVVRPVMVPSLVVRPCDVRDMDVDALDLRDISWRQSRIRSEGMHREHRRHGGPLFARWLGTRLLGTSLLGTSLLSASLVAASLSGSAAAAESYVKDGVWFYQDADGKPAEVALFGVNYNLPFAFGYRAVQSLGMSHQEAIRMDVAHLARLGVTAYRIHLWDRLISDHDGNLLNNTHLQLFDFLLAELQRYGIKVVITPIGWWGSGYPAPDPAEPGFSVRFSKNQMNENSEAIAAQHRYLAQLMAHKNSNGIAYGQDPNILAFELFNEPKHADATRVTAYVNGLVKVMRDAGVTKPLFYNISEQGNWPEYAKALCESAIDGVSYQWYPTGLLKYSTLHSNVLAAVATYHHPFANIAACASKARMIYEFDAADVRSPVLYPAMARSFRSAGFQWATQFAYDPAVLAASNAEYNTHYFNLLYTPAKAISFLIAGEVFRQLPRGTAIAPYPASNNFATATLDIRLDHAQQLAQLNSATRFYHTHSTSTAPRDIQQLQHIAAVGSSPVVTYQGSGAYFLDRYEAGLWLLEVYPDATELDDPHQNSSLKREAVRLSQHLRDIHITLPDLGANFVWQAADAAPSASHLMQSASKGRFAVTPGRYWLARSETQLAKIPAGSTRLTRPFLLPKLNSQPPTLVHQPLRQWPVDQPLPICAQLAGRLVHNHRHPATQSPSVPHSTPSQPTATAHLDTLQLRVFYRLAGSAQVQQQPMIATDNASYCAQLNLPRQSGELQYQVVLSQHDTTLSFPGAIAATPSDWDFPQSPHHQYTTLLQQPGAAVPIFDARYDQSSLLYPKDAAVTQQWLAGERQQGLMLRLRPDKTAAWQQPPLPLLRTETQPVMGLRHRDLSAYRKVAIKMRAVHGKLPIRFALLNQDGLAFGIDLEASSEWRYQLVPLSALRAMPSLLSQAYPTFMPPSLPHQTPSLGDLAHLQGTQWQLLAPSDGNNALEIAEVSLLP